MNLFNLVAKIKLDTDQYESQVKKASKQGKELEGTFGGIGAKAVVMGNIATDVIRKVGNGIVTAGKIGIGFNSQIESYTANFKVMLGDAELATKKVEELKTMASKTPFGLEDLANATQQLLAFQVPANKTNHILQMLGDISLGNKEKLKGLALVFGQVSSAGKLQGQDLMQMINQGFNPLNYIAKRTGESMGELRERMSKGAIGIDEVTQAFEDATSEGGQFYQGMEVASTTTAGLMSTLSDTVKEKLGQLFASASESAKTALPDIIEFVQNLDVEKMTNKLQSLAHTFVELLPIITGITTATIAYKSAVAIAGLIEALKKATEGQTLAQAILNSTMLANPFVLVTTLVVGLVTAIITLWHTNEGFRDAIIQIGKNIVNAFVTTGENIKRILTKSIPNAFHQLVASAKTWGSDMIQNFINGIKAKIAHLVNTVKGVAKKVKNLLGFSEPKEGPLSNFHTYAPDMMQLFSKGIKDNEKLVTRQVKKSFNLEPQIKTATKMQPMKEASGVTIIQNIHSKAMTASDLMQEALYKQERGLFLGV